MTPQRQYADLEAGLSRAADGTCQVELRFTNPESETEIPPLRGEIQLEPEDLKQHRLDAEAYGKALGEAILPDASIRRSDGTTTSLLGHYRQIQANVEGGDLFLRLRLRIDADASDLQALRWELARDPETGDRLATSQRILFSRFMASQDWRTVKLLPKSELRALVAVSSPSDLGLDEDKAFELAEVKLDEEIARAQSALEGIHVELAGKDQPLTLDHLVESLQDIDILYLVCHGQYSRKRKEPLLYLQKPDGTTDVARGADLAERFRELARPPRLVFLASCESAVTEEGADVAGEATAQASLAPRLAQAGASAIIAMQGKISMTTIEQAMPVFFRELLQDGRIDRALSVARGKVRENRDAWMPALYTRLKGGRLWYEPGFAGGGNEFEKWKSICRRVRQGKFIPILGPDVGEAVRGTSGELAARLADKEQFPLAPHERLDLAKVSQFISIHQDREYAQGEVEAQLRNLLLQKNPHLASEAGAPRPLPKLLDDIVAKRKSDASDAYTILAELPGSIYVTASRDTLLYKTLVALGRNPQRPVFCNWRPTAESHPTEPSVDHASFDEPLVYHVFGVFGKKTSDSLVLTEDDFFDYLIATSTYKLMPTVVRGSLTESSLLFLGFPLDDWTFRVLFRLIMTLEGSAGLKKYSHVGVQVDPEEHSFVDVQRARKYLEGYFGKDRSGGLGRGEPGIDIYWGTAADFLQELAAKLKQTQEEEATVTVAAVEDEGDWF